MPLRKELQKRPAKKNCRKELLDIFILMFDLSNKSSNSANLLNTSFSQSQNARYARTPCIRNPKQNAEIPNISMIDV